MLGAAIFVFGTVHQAKCHRILAELKASRRPTLVRNCRRYGIPRGSWFEYCSCAHYLVRGFAQRTDGFPALSTVDMSWRAQGGDSDLRRPCVNLRLSLQRGESYCQALAAKHMRFQSHRRAASSQMLLLFAVVANLQFAATLTHEWYLENVPVRLAVRCVTGSQAEVTSVTQDYPRSRAALWPSWT